MPKVYVSSHDVERAREAAAALEAAGHTVVSTWHLGTGPLKPRADMTADEMRDKARANAHQIGFADALVLVASDDRVPGGKFVEAGIALGKGKRVVVWGRRENILLHHPDVRAADTLADLVTVLGGRSAAVPSPPSSLAGVLATAGEVWAAHHKAAIAAVGDHFEAARQAAMDALRVDAKEVARTLTGTTPTRGEALDKPA